MVKQNETLGGNPKRVQPRKEKSWLDKSPKFSLSPYCLVTGKWWRRASCFSWHERFFDSSGQILWSFGWLKCLYQHVPVTKWIAKELGGGNSNIFGILTPTIWGRFTKFWLAHIFQMGGKKPPIKIHRLAGERWQGSDQGVGLLLSQPNLGAN